MPSRSHAPSNQSKELNGICENPSAESNSAPDSISRASTPSCVTLTASDAQLLLNNHLNNVNLLSLLVFIDMLEKCPCIWHWPTRQSGPRINRLYAYGILVARMRGLIPSIRFHEVRQMVHSLLHIYNEMSAPGGPDNNEAHSSRNMLESLRDDDFALVMQRLSFLSGQHIPDIAELDISMYCAFCSRGFPTSESLWVHMVENHLPLQNDLLPGEPLLRPPTPYPRNIDYISVEESTESLGDQVFQSPSEARDRTSDIEMRNVDSEGHPLVRPTTAVALSIPIPGSKSGRSVPATIPPIDSCSSMIVEQIGRCSQRGSLKESSMNRSRQMSKIQSIAEKRKSEQMQVQKSKGQQQSRNFGLKLCNSFVNDHDDDFLIAFIEKYHQWGCLWDKNRPDYKAQRQVSLAYADLTKFYRQRCSNPSAKSATIRGLITRLNKCYERMKRPLANQYRSYIWQRMSFVDGSNTTNRTLRSRLRSVASVVSNNKHFQSARNYEIQPVLLHPPTECYACCQSFQSAMELRGHVIQHHPDHVYCPMCPQSTNNLDWQSESHMSMHFPNPLGGVGGAGPDNVNVLPLFGANNRSETFIKCAHCDAVFSRSMEYRRHSRIIHHDPKPFKCEDCSTSFKCMAPWIKHEQQHKRN